jgi:hypothetical protein
MKLVETFDNFRRVALWIGLNKRPTEIGLGGAMELGLELMKLMLGAVLANVDVVVGTRQSWIVVEYL